jgi:NADPH-dependent 2,4-dienoyl-CoA reductase/sulfur reductase-like enzyme
MTALRNIVVVGASVAGLGAVGALRAAGYEARLTLVGEEAHPPYNRPPLSKDVLAGASTPESTLLAQPDRLERLDVELVLGSRATALDLGARTVQVGGRALPFDGLVIATGASPRRLPGLKGLEGVYTLRTLDDAVALRDALAHARRLVIVGAGFIGAEVASTANARGVAVTVVELADEPLAVALGSQIAKVCASLHAEHGVELRTGVTVARVEGTAHVERVVLTDGSTMDADLVLVAVGVHANTNWLEGSGLDLRNGVVCDAALNAGHPDVFAAGDVARWHNELFGREMRVEHWTNADEQGVHAAENLLAGRDAAKPFLGVNYVWSDQYGVRLQFAGVVAEDVEIVDGSVQERRFTAWYRSEGMLVGAVGIGSPKLIAKSRRLIKQRVSWTEALDALAA